MAERNPIQFEPAQLDPDEIEPDRLDFPDRLDLEERKEDAASSCPASPPPALLAASASTVVLPASFGVSRSQIWSYFGPAFVASVAYIDPGNFATHIAGGSR